MKKLQIITIFILVIPAICGAAEGNWISLFDGKSLKGWT